MELDGVKVVRTRHRLDHEKTEVTVRDDSRYPEALFLSMADDRKCVSIGLSRQEAKDLAADLLAWADE